MMSVTSDRLSYSRSMRDSDIRGALLDRLSSEFQGDRIRSEMGLCLGATRVDVAVINGSLHGYEIKSDRDTLARLPAQVEIYNRVLDYSTIVCGTKYLEKIKSIVPEWWGITEVTGPDSNPTFVHHRDPCRNASVDPLSIAQLLWRDEAAELLECRGEQVKRRETRWNLWDRLAALPLDELQSAVRAQLKARQQWTASR